MTTPGVRSHPRTEGLQWSHSIPGQNDSPGVVTIPGLKDSPGVVPFQVGMTLLESFYPRTAVTLLGVVISQGLNYSPSSHYIPEQNDSPEVVISLDRMTPLESFYTRT